MELDTLDGKAPVAEAHDLAVLGAGRDLEIGGEALVQHHERMIARGLETLGQRLEDATVVVLDGRRLAVHLLLRPRHRSPEGLADGLMAEADTQNGRGL